MKVHRECIYSGLFRILKICNIFFWILTGILSHLACDTKNSTPGSDIAGGQLEKGFRNPPMQARPRAYWSWMNGNVDLPRLTYELEEYRDKGFGGLDIFDIGAVDPDKVVPAGNQFMGKESVDAIVYAINEAKRLGLELGLVASSSWNAGGTWITPEHAAMLLYKSEVVVNGPADFSGILPFPEVSSQTPRKADGIPEFYKNVAVIAFPDASENSAIDQSVVADLTEQMDIQGHLTWKIPPGKWKILRLVCSNSGQKLVLPSPKSSGYNIDHFNPKATEMHFQYLVDRLQKEIGDFTSFSIKVHVSLQLRIAGVGMDTGIDGGISKPQGLRHDPLSPRPIWEDHSKQRNYRPVPV